VSDEEAVAGRELPIGTSMHLRRSLLFIPGAEPRKLEKSRAAGADTLIFDLEDAVAPELKMRAREMVVETLRAGEFGVAEPAVRINAAATPYFDEDLAAVVEAGARAIVLPKSETAAGLAGVAMAIEAAEHEQDETGRVKLLALVETAAGITNVSSLAAATSRVDALCFGHADFSLDMGLAEADASTGIIFHARCMLALAAKAGGVAPIDNVCLAVKDESAFRADVELGRRLGFEGKLCIHPVQVGIANDVYTPTADQIAYARRVLEGWEQARADGRGVFTMDAKMVDAPLVAVQERILERARRAGVLDE
jgi:citrate lyase subunit beta/citryl-CoA lyase